MFNKNVNLKPLRKTFKCPASLASDDPCILLQSSHDKLTQNIPFEFPTDSFTWPANFQRVSLLVNSLRQLYCCQICRQYFLFDSRVFIPTVFWALKGQRTRAGHFRLWGRQCGSNVTSRPTSLNKMIQPSPSRFL